MYILIHIYRYIMYVCKYNYIFYCRPMLYTSVIEYLKAMTTNNTVKQ